MNYPEWQDTADTLHLFLQMAGKVKLMRSPRRPEWANIALYLQPDGLTTGIIPGDTSPFTIFYDLRQHQVEFKNAEGKRVDVALEDGLSVADFYRHFSMALDQMGSPTAIRMKPQEFEDTTDFDQDTKHHSYDKIAVRKWLQSMLFAYEAMSLYLIPFGGKVHYPAYYFGAMDLSCTVFSGEPAPWDGKGTICQDAFDERMYRCGFYPGDLHAPQATFYAMPYPFLDSLKGNSAMLQPDKALFNPEDKKFLLTLEDTFSYADPKSVVTAFFRSGFDIFQQIQSWEYLDRILQKSDTLKRNTLS